MENLELARIVSEHATESFESGEIHKKVTPITAELLKFWFDESYCDTREKNFHKGQKQAILNVIYLHEVVKAKNILEVYEKVASDLFVFADMQELSEEKYSYAKYCIKMATGTGKTWVMHALLIWQMLNAKHTPITEGEEKRYTSNFLVVAPGLIVYDRLLDAFIGRMDEKTGERNFLLNDFHLNEELFIPPYYRDEVYSFLQNNVKQKTDIRSISGGGLIAITNWHLFIDKAKNETEIQDEDLDELSYKKRIVDDLLETRPGTSAGNSLDVLDNQYLKGETLEYLADLDSLMIINDEAHHIHNNKTKDDDVVWQQGINYIMKNKKGACLQVDFSATPYTQTGTGRNARKLYFPHIITDFHLNSAILEGLVKLLNIDQRQAVTDIKNLDYRAVRDERNNVISLSQGQKLLLNAGMTHLNMLDKAFKELSKGEEIYKQPKMLVICEDTDVSPLVVEYLINSGLQADDVLQIDSNKQGEVKSDEWKEIKNKLFNIDKHSKPRVVVSVLMLREGFDVNNICVIVPLRSSSSGILLEQIIGRGLRLMFREREFEEEKKENRQLVLEERKSPKSFLDMLFIVEHPAFVDFYNELLQQRLAIVGTDESKKTPPAGDLKSVQLKEDYKDYDLYFPLIIKDEEEEIKPFSIDAMQLPMFDMYSLEMLQKYLAKPGEVITVRNVHSKTTIQQFKINEYLFSAETYNEYLQNIINVILYHSNRVNKRDFPLLQISGNQLVSYIDTYIKKRLFGKDFNPFENNNWKILLIQNGAVTTHITKVFTTKIHKYLINELSSQAVIQKIYFSQIKSIIIRDIFCVKVSKSIYPYLRYPSSNGGLEKSFIEYCESQSEVKSFVKIDESRHRFAYIPYINEDGLLAKYIPDFIVRSIDEYGKEIITIVETKGKDRMSSDNVKRKRTAVLEWIKRINNVDSAHWRYALISDNTFYSCVRNNITFNALIDLNKVTTNQIKETLF